MSPVSWTWAAYEFLKMKIPHVFLWSPHIFPRPSEWDANVAVAGYTYEKGSIYSPPKSLEIFLETDKPVLAIGFGSASIPDPVKLMNMVFNAVETIGAKAVVCIKSSKLNSALPIPDHIFFTEEIPHGWLLPRVQGFVHHGGAGSTAAGLKAGVPMLLVPFFLDQHFWAAQTQTLQLGPPPLDHRALTPQTLSASLGDLISRKYQARCSALASQISSEPDGALIAAETISRTQLSSSSSLAQDQKINPRPRCTIIPSLKSHWRHTSSGLPLSGAAAACLTAHRILHWTDLALEPGPHPWSLQGRSRSWPNAALAFLTLFTAFLGRVLDILVTVAKFLLEPPSSWSSGSSSTKEEEEGLEPRDRDRVRDHVRDARIAQAEFDLAFLKRQRAGAVMDGDGDIEEGIMGAWGQVRKRAFLGTLGVGGKGME